MKDGRILTTGAWAEHTYVIFSLIDKMNKIEYNKTYKYSKDIHENSNNESR